MVKELTTAMVAACGIWIFVNPVQAQQQQTQQSQQSMQQQETAANSQTSASGTATYSTPYKLFQAYYAGVTGTSTAAMYACFTQSALNAAFEGTPPTTPSDFATMDTANLQRSPQNYVLRSFNFTANPTSPQIAAVFTFTVNNPQNSAQQMTITETDNLTLTDTGMGWMINVYNEH